MIQLQFSLQPGVLGLDLHMYRRLCGMTVVLDYSECVNQVIHRSYEDGVC